MMMKLNTYCKLYSYRFMPFYLSKLFIVVCNVNIDARCLVANKFNFQFFVSLSEI